MLELRIFANVGLINAIVTAFLGAQIFWRNRRDAANVAFTIMAFSVAAWAFAYWRWLSSGEAASALVWIRIFTFASVIIPVVYFHWVTYVLGLGKKYKSALVALWAVSASLLLSVFGSDFVVRGVHPRLIFPFWPIPGVLYAYYVAFIYIGLVVWGLYILIRNLEHQTDEVRRSQIRYMLLGSVVGFGGGLTNFFLWFNILIPPYLNILVAVGFTILYYAASKNNLFNAKVIATEFFAYLLLLAVATRFVFSSSLEDLAVNFLVLALTSVFGVQLIESVRREVEQREKLQKLSKELDELSHFKTQLLSLASHQIKAPLAAIKGFASILMDGLYGPVNDKIKDALVKIKQSSDDLIALIDNLLDLRRVEEGKMEYKLEKVEINDLAKNVFDELAPLAKTKNLEFVFKPCDECEVSADPQKLKQVVQNLIDNAIKYTPKGFVRVELDIVGGEVRLSVRDSGFGISKDLMPHLFEEFIRDEKIKRKVRGTGLGLFIAKKMMEAQNGKIWAESAGDNGGSTFYMSLKKV